MNEKEVGEIRRTLRPGRTTAPAVYGCYVNATGTVIARFERSLGLLGEEESEKYLSLFRKSLSGTLHKNLLDIPFSAAQVSNGEEHRLLMTLRESALADEDARNRFFDMVAGAIRAEENYVILLLSARYDVPHREKGDDREGERLSDAVFSFLCCAICPVRDTGSSLAYDPCNHLFREIGGASAIAAPAAGFLFPTFDERQSNLYNALFYTRDPADAKEELTEAIFGAHVEMTAPAQGEAFREVLTDALGKECDLRLVKALRGRIQDAEEAHRERNERETLTISLPEMAGYLSDSGVPEEEIEAFRERGSERFGRGAELYPKNILETKKFEMRTPEIVIRATPAGVDLIETRVIDGKKYILIEVEEKEGKEAETEAEKVVEVNGIPLAILPLENAR